MVEERPVGEDLDAIHPQGMGRVAGRDAAGFGPQTGFLVGCYGLEGIKVDLAEFNLHQQHQLTAG